MHVGKEMAQAQGEKHFKTRGNNLRGFTAGNNSAPTFRVGRVSWSIGHSVAYSEVNASVVGQN